MGISFLEHVEVESDGFGLSLYDGARVYKKAGTGLVTRLHAANTRMQVENNAGSILGTYWDSGNLPVTWSGSSLGVPGTVEMRGHSLGDGVNVGSTADTSWLLVAQHISTGQGISKKFEVDLMGGDFADRSVYKLVFDSFNTDGSTTTYHVRRVWSGWTNAETELFQKIEIKVFRETSSGIFRVYLRGAAVGYFQLTAVVRVADGSSVDSYYPTVQALPTTGWTEIGVSAGELPVRMLLDSCYMRNTSLARDAVYTYGDAAEIANWAFDGTGIAASHRVDFKASTTSIASMRVTQGVAPTTPGNGDVWQDGSYFYFRNATGNRYFASTAGLTTNAIPKASGAGILSNGLLSDTGTEIQQSSGLYRFYNPNLTDFVIAFTRGTAGAPDANSAFVMRMDGYHEWGAGGGSARDTNCYRGGANLLKTDDTFDAAVLRGQNITASRALVSDGSKNIVASATTSTQIGYLSTLTSNVQTQIDSKAAANAWTSQTAAIATGVAAYFNDIAVGDLAWRFGSSASKARLGVFDGAAGTNSSSIWLATGGAGFSGYVQFDALTADTVLALNGSRIAYSAFAVRAPNFGTTLEGLGDPFTSRTSYDTRGGVRTASGSGPFGGTWYNMVDVRHRNAWTGGDVYGGELVWGMTSSQTRMAFRSRAADGTPGAWTEVWTKADISDANMPRLNANQTWTGQNSFLLDNSFKANGFNYLGGALASGGFFAAPSTDGLNSSEPYHGINFDTYAGATKVGMGVIPTNPVNTVSDGFYVQSNGVGTVPKVAIVGRDLEIKPVTTFGGSPYSGKLSIWGESFHSFDVAALQSVTTSNASMTGIRLRITSTTAREVTLPDPANHSLAIIMVEEAALSGKHRIYPPSGSEIRWTDHAGTSRYSAASGVPAGSQFLVALGMYWFVSDGNFWYALSTGSAT